MLHRRDLDTLLKYTPSESSPVLSLYLNVDLSRPANRNRGIQVAARGLFGALRDELDSSPGTADLDEDLASVESFLESYASTGRSLVLFCDASQGFLWHRTLPVALPPDAHYGPDPYLRPLLETFDEQERYGVVLLDRQQARLFSVFLGVIDERPGALAPLDVRTIRTIGTDHLWSEKRFKRRADGHAHLHLKQVALRLRDLQLQSGFDRLVIAGPVEATSELQRLLPRALADRVAAVLKLPIETRETELLREVMDLQDERESARERELVQELISAAGQGHQAVLGLAATLEAIREARVLRLLYISDEPVQGGVCTACGTLAQRRQGSCSFCQKPLRRVRDLIARMARTVAESGGRLENVRWPTADQLRAAGGIGALLRF